MIQKEAIDVLQSAGLHLRKWSSNNHKLLERIPEEDRETITVLSFDKDQSVLTLGIKWSPIEDVFQFEIKLSEHNVHTKRTMLSDISKIFNPLG